MLIDAARTLRSQMNSSIRRTMSSLGWSEGRNNTESLGNRLHQYLQNLVGAARVKYVAFCGVLFTFFIYILATQDYENALLQQNHMSLYHKNTFPKPLPSPIPSNSSATNDTSTIPPPISGNSTEVIVDPSNSSDNTYSFFTSILFTLLAWLLLIQLLTCVRRVMVSSSSMASQRRRQQLEMLSQLTAMSRSNVPGLSTRLRLAMLQRDFTGEDYEMLQQLDEVQFGGGGPSRHAASQSTINRLPIHKVTQEEIDNHAAEGRSSSSVHDSGVEESKDVESRGSRAASANAELTHCHICLGPYEVGDEVRTMVCLHKFHRQCIDPWLRTNAVCPICKFPVNSLDAEQFE